MKHVRQFCMILLFSFIGEFFRMVIPLPVPASVYGLVLLLAALLTGVIKLDQVEGAADFLIEIMPVMFIPAAVGMTFECMGFAATGRGSGGRSDGSNNCTCHGSDRTGDTACDPLGEKT